MKSIEPSTYRAATSCSLITTSTVGVLGKHLLRHSQASTGRPTEPQPRSGRPVRLPPALPWAHLIHPPRGTPTRRRPLHDLAGVRRKIDVRINIEAASPSILFRVAGAPDAKSFHHVKQSSAFQAKPCGRAIRTTEFPLGALARGANFLANCVLQRGVRTPE